MMYAKLINGVLYYATPVIVPKERFIFKPKEEQLLAAGYLPVHHTPAPETQNGKKLSCKWVEKDGAIMQEWEVRNKKQTTHELARQMVVQTADDNTALRMKSFYPEWAENTAYAAGHKVQYNGELYKCIQAHTAIVTWEPVNTASLWVRINETHGGTLEDPIPYNGNMALENGKHYVQNSIIYLCNRDTVNPVHHALAELVGLYVTEV